MGQKHLVVAKNPATDVITLRVPPLLLRVYSQRGLHQFGGKIARNLQRIPAD